MRTPKDIRNIHVGTSGWSLSRQLAPGSRPQLSGLERYAEYFNAVEINSTFYRLPRRTTIERWRDSTPKDFRFAVKLPRSITHEARLVAVESEVSGFCDLIASFQHKLGPLLVQLPPSLELELDVTVPFFEHLTRVCPARVVLEPRHPSWFGADGDRVLSEQGVARVGADPVCCSAAATPLGHPIYHRWHGSPRMYFSAYAPERLAWLAAELLSSRQGHGAPADVYCFLDNTALGAAAVDALSLKAELIAAAARQRPERTPRPNRAASDGWRAGEARRGRGQTQRRDSLPKPI